MTKEKGRAGIPLGLVVNTLSFLCGGLGGLLLALWSAESGSLSLGWLLGGYALVLDAGAGGVAFSAVLWDAARWPLLAWALGFTAVGVWALPLLFLVRGFLLFFCVTGLTAAAGEGGLALAGVLFGAGSLIPVPIFFSLGVRSWETARLLRGRLFPRKGDRALYPRAHWIRSAVGLGGILCCVLMEYFLFPPLLRWLVPLIS